MCQCQQAHLTQVHNLSAQWKTGKNLAVLIKEELENLQKLDAHPIGVVGDASSDERKARTLILKDDPSLLIADCWAHQVRTSQKVLVVLGLHHQ